MFLVCAELIVMIMMQFTLVKLSNFNKRYAEHKRDQRSQMFKRKNENKHNIGSVQENLGIMHGSRNKKNISK